MKKIFCLMMILLTTFVIGCGQGQKSSDVNQIPTEIATPQDVEKKSDEPQEPAPQAQPDKDYILANDDLSNLQLDDPTKPVYDKYILWERQEKNLPFTLPYLEPYNAESVVYLTFDDGPDNKVTP